LAPGWILGIIIGYVLFNLGLWKSDSEPKPKDTLWALVMLGGTILMFISVLLWAVPTFFSASN
jgi:membrane-bound ClpP family serine protease